MQVFISWAGQDAHRVAEGLRKLLCGVLNFDAKDVYISSSMPKGVNWRQDVLTNLSGSDLGIICLTPASLEAKWVLFEAGALVGAVSNRPLYTFLCGLRPHDVPDDNPLGMFQHTSSSQEDTKKMLVEINDRLRGSKKVRDHKVLEDRFRNHWKEFESTLPTNGHGSPQPQHPRRPLDDMVADVLDTVRELRSQSSLAYTADRHKLLTTYIGEFPAIFDDIRRLVSSAERSIRIICDFLAYGTFSEPDNARVYRGLLQRKSEEFRENDNDGMVVIVVPEPIHQLHLQAIQFGKAAGDWQRLCADSTFLSRLSAVNENFEPRYQVSSMESFHRYLQQRERNVRSELEGTGVLVKQVAEIPTTFCWIIDEREAIFTIPIFGRDAHEQSFHTCDVRLLKTFMSMFEYYGEDKYVLHPSRKLSSRPKRK